MSDDTAAQSEQLRQQIESQAGAAFVGADARGLIFTFDREQNHTLNYLTAVFDGFASAEEARAEMFSFVLGHAFSVLGNRVELRRIVGLAPASGFPQGAVLVWRGGHTPLLGVDQDGVWSVQMTYCLLPPFAHVVG